MNRVARRFIRRHLPTPTQQPLRNSAAAQQELLAAKCPHYAMRKAWQRGPCVGVLTSTIRPKLHARTAVRSARIAGTVRISDRLT